MIPLYLKTDLADPREVVGMHVVLSRYVIGQDPGDYNGLGPTRHRLVSPSVGFGRLHSVFLRVSHFAPNSDWWLVGTVRLGADGHVAYSIHNPGCSLVG